MWYPHVQLDVDFFSLIPQMRKKWLARSQQHDGMVVDMVEKFQQGFVKWLREDKRMEGEEGGLSSTLHSHAPLLFI